MDQENVRAADGFVNGGEHLAVGEVANLRAAQLDADQLADVPGEVDIGIAGENLHVFSV